LLGSGGKLSVVGDRENLTVASSRYEHPFTLAWLTEDVPIQESVCCLKEGRPMPVNGQDGLLATAVLQAIACSLESGEVVPVEDVGPESKE